MAFDRIPTRFGRHQAMPRLREQMGYCAGRAGWGFRFVLPNLPNFPDFALVWCNES
jgi:hypothetical protein